MWREGQSRRVNPPPQETKCHAPDQVGQHVPRVFDSHGLIDIPRLSLQNVETVFQLHVSAHFMKQTNMTFIALHSSFTHIIFIQLIRKLFHRLC